MTRVSSRFRSRWDGQAYTLGNNPFRRIQFGISAFILFGGLVAAAVNGGLSGGSILGMVLFGAIFFTSFWVAGYRRYFRIEPANQVLIAGRSFFGFALGPVESYSLSSGVEIQVVSIPIYGPGAGGPGTGGKSPGAHQSRSLTKLLLITPEVQLFIDESSYAEEIEQLAREIETLQLRKI